MLSESEENRTTFFPCSNQARTPPASEAQTLAPRSGCGGAFRPAGRREARRRQTGGARDHLVGPAFAAAVSTKERLAPPGPESTPHARPSSAVPGLRRLKGKSQRRSPHFLRKVSAPLPHGLPEEPGGAICLKPTQTEETFPKRNKSKCRADLG